jgi:DNA-binding Xre family transcriptional regulator
VIRKMGYRWHLRQLMARAEMYATSDLVPLLSERGVELSREQVYRLVTSPPQRLSMDVLAALCDILDCTPNDLIEVVQVDASVRKTATGDTGPTGAGRADAKPAPPVRRSTIRRPEGL